MKGFRSAVMAAVIAMSVACGSSTSTPTAPTGNATTVTFTGGFGVGGSGPPHNFTIAQSNGLLNIVLTAVNNPDGTAAGVALGLALGSQSSSGCVGISGATTTVTAGTTSITSGLSGTANSGAYCLIVYDPVVSPNASLLTGPITYSVDVSHF
jgi:hypothetical protein